MVVEPEKVLLKASPMSGKTAVFTHLKTCPMILHLRCSDLRICSNLMSMTVW